MEKRGGGRRKRRKGIDNLEDVEFTNLMHGLWD